MKESAHSGSKELIISISFQSSVQWHHVCSLHQPCWEYFHSGHWQILQIRAPPPRKTSLAAHHCLNNKYINRQKCTCTTFFKSTISTHFLNLSKCYWEQWNRLAQVNCGTRISTWVFKFLSLRSQTPNAQKERLP